MHGAFDIPPTLAERVELCQFMAQADLLPQKLREKPANVLLIMYKALALDIPLMVAIEHMYVIDGKVDHSAELLRVLLHRHGHLVSWPSMNDKEVTGRLVLRHDPKNPREEKFSMVDATRMGLADKENYKKDPKSMLVARCTTRLVSYHCPEIAAGLTNLSGLDFEDERPTPEPVQATAEVDRASQVEQATELLRRADTVETLPDITKIGKEARAADLLDVVVDDDGTTVGKLLLKRVAEIKASAKSTPPTEAPSEVSPE